MDLVGLLGGVASGKSLVARQLAQLGAGVLDADRAAHEVLAFPEVSAAIRQRWGDGVFLPDGRIDRGALSAIVFAPPPDGPRHRQYLEQLTHPHVRRILEEQRRAMAAAGLPAAVLDVPLLLEVGWTDLCDYLMFVDAPRDARQQRAQSRGWTDQQFSAREAAQIPIEQKRRRADVVIDNSGTAAQTAAQVERWWQSTIAPGLPPPQPQTAPP